MGQTRYPSKSRVFKNRFSFKVRQHGQQQLYLLFTTLLVHTTNTTISTKKSVPLLQSIFTSLFYLYLFTKSFLQSPLTISSSIPQQFVTSLFLRTAIPTIYTKNIFLTQPFSQSRLRQGTRELGSFVESLVRTDTVLISTLYLKVWTVITGLTITDSSSFRLRKLIYCRCGKPSNPPSLIPSTYCHYFHTLLIPPQELTFPGNQLLNFSFTLTLV